MSIFITKIENNYEFIKINLNIKSKYWSLDNLNSIV